MREVLLVAVALATMGYDQVQDHPVRAIKFAPGRSTATVSQTLERGTADTWRFDAKAGQQADIRIASVETNAAFTLYPPPSTVSRGVGGMDVKGTALDSPVRTRSALDDGAQTHWQGTLPKTGSYYVQVVPDRGGATYQLTVGIR